MNCTKPDRDQPELTCGHPLPCPYHTVTIDTTMEPVSTIIIPATIPTFQIFLHRFGAFLAILSIILLNFLVFINNIPGPISQPLFFRLNNLFKI